MTQAVSGQPRPLLELCGVTKRFGSQPVLRGIDLDVRDNEFLCVLGPSGSGKTTVLRVIGGFESIDDGALMFEGRDLAAVPINRRPFNTVFQDYALFHHMSVGDNVGYGLRVRGVGRAARRKKVAETLEIVGLGAMSERYPAQLSGGQRQRVALARAIICEPRIILLDEPLAALDVSLRAQMQRFLKDMQRRLGITFLFVTHDQEEAVVLADRIVVVRDGNIEQSGTADEVYRAPATSFVATFFGENNLIAARNPRAEHGVVLVETPLGPLRSLRPGGRPAPDGACLLAIRPERIAVDKPGATGGDDRNRIPAQTLERRFLGPSCMIDFRPTAAPDLCLRVRLLSGAPSPALGEPVVLTFSPEDAALIDDGARA